jgi:hypothetical protein
VCLICYSFVIITPVSRLRLGLACTAQKIAGVSWWNWWIFFVATLSLFKMQYFFKSSCQNYMRFHVRHAKLISKHIFNNLRWNFVLFMFAFLIRRLFVYEITCSGRYNPTGDIVRRRCSVTETFCLSAVLCELDSIPMPDSSYLVWSTFRFFVIENNSFFAFV